MIALCNLTKEKVPQKQLQALVEGVLRKEKKNKDLSVVFVGSSRMSRLNKSYRNKDYAANVLSFAGEGSELGEVVLCPSTIRKDAKNYGITYERALRWMLIHGVLHLLGHEHETKAQEQAMKNKEEFYLS